MSESSWEPEPRPDTKEAHRLEEALRRAAEHGHAREALSLMHRIEELARSRPWCGVAATELTALGSLGRVAGRDGVPDIASLARRIQDLAEPWFEADHDGFGEVAAEARHTALHTLMYIAGRAGQLDIAIMLRRADDAGNARADARWARDFPLDEAAPAFLHSAWGALGLIMFLVEGGRFDALAEFLDNLARYLDATGGGREDQETRDALGEAEAEALATVLGAEVPPPALKARCLARAAALDAIAVPLSDWPRTRKALAELIGPTQVH
jgi:hypothetical protein